MKVEFTVGKRKELSVEEIPIGRAFTYSTNTSSRYVRLGEDVFLGLTGAVYSLSSMAGGKFTLLPEGTTVTITT